MEISCSECGTKFTREVSHRYLYMTVVTAVGFIIFAMVVLLGLATGTVDSTPTLLSGYGVVFTALFSVAFYALSRGEKRRNTLCSECIKKAERKDSERKLTWR